MICTYGRLQNPTSGSVRFRPVSIVLNNDNRLEPDATAGQRAVGFWSRPLCYDVILFHLSIFACMPWLAALKQNHWTARRHFQHTILIICDPSPAKAWFILTAFFFCCGKTRWFLTKRNDFPLPCAICRDDGSARKICRRTQWRCLCSQEIFSIAYFGAFTYFMDFIAYE